MQHSKYDIAKLQFDLFCEKRGYEVMSFMTNYKNKDIHAKYFIIRRVRLIVI